MADDDLKASRGWLTAVELVGSDGHEVRVRLEHVKVFPEITEYHLGLGEDFLGQRLRVESSAGPDLPFQVEMQWETSVSIQDEGAHLDLVNWKHYTSEWMPLERVGRHSFVIPLLTEREAKAFPEVDVKELCDVVSSLGGERWSRQCTRVESIYKYPARIGISMVRFRVLAQKSGEWTPVAITEFSVPMGS